MTMLIRELAQRTGVSSKTIRYYESVGLLPCPQRASNHYRLYRDTDVELLRFIVGARSLGYPLAEIAQFLAARDNGSLPCQQVLASLEARLHEIERRIADLQVVRATLEQIRQEAQTRPQPPICDDRCVPSPHAGSFHQEGTLKARTLPERKRNKMQSTLPTGLLGRRWLILTISLIALSTVLFVTGVVIERVGTVSTPASSHQ